MKPTDKLWFVWVLRILYTLAFPNVDRSTCITSCFRRFSVGPQGTSLRKHAHGRDAHIFENDRCVLGKWAGFMLTVGQEGSPLIKINGGSDIWAVVFAPNGEYLVSGSAVGGVRVWRVEDGKQMATVEARAVKCLAVSKDDRWIGAGTDYGDVIVWHTKTYEKVLSNTENGHNINGVDFSPDSTRLISASDDCTATIWDIATRKRVQTLRHGDWVRAAKYSPQGDRIATATENSVRIWDSNGGRPLVDITVTVIPWYNSGLLWFNDNLFVISDSKVKQLNASTGLAVSEWLVPGSDNTSCIALPKHGGLIAYSAKDTVTFLDTSTHAQLGLIQHPQKIRSSVLSPDDRFLANVGRGGIIAINSLVNIQVSVLSCSIVVHIDHFLSPIIFPTCITRCYTKDVITDVSNRRTCIFYLETRAWRAETTRVRYDPSGVHEPKCDPTQVERSRRSR